MKKESYTESKFKWYFSLKPENILIGPDGYIKLADFGLSQYEVGIINGATQKLGTPEYIAPEILQEKEYGRSADWWAFGCVVFEMLKGYPPFYHKDWQKMF